MSVLASLWIRHLWKDPNELENTNKIRESVRTKEKMTKEGKFLLCMKREE